MAAITSRRNLRVSITGDDNIGYLEQFRTVYQPKLYRKSTLDWKESVACYYWERNLKHLWKYYDAKLYDFGFVPVAYYDINSINGVKKRGTEGEHFAEGYGSLYNLIEKYGVFDEPGKDDVSFNGLPLLVDYNCTGGGKGGRNVYPGYRNLRVRLVLAGSSYQISGASFGMGDYL